MDLYFFDIPLWVGGYLVWLVMMAHGRGRCNPPAEAPARVCVRGVHRY